VIDLSVVILTYNEERHIERAIASLSGMAAEVLVVDSYSTDRTVEIALQRGARVLQHPFISQAAQFEWALKEGGISTAWIMRLDADEVIGSDLVAEIELKLPTLPFNITGVNLCRKHIFMGRWIRHGGRYPLTLLRLWRAGKARIEQRWMDEHMVLLEGRSVTFAGEFSDHNLNDLTFFIDKHNRYATREAIEIINQSYKLFNQEGGVASALPASAARKRKIKQKIYNKLPFWLGPPMYFLLRYVFQLGILDGREGLIYHFLQGFWYRFLVGSKVVELREAIDGLSTNAERITELSRLTGLSLQRSAA